MGGKAGKGEEKGEKGRGRRKKGKKLRAHEVFKVAACFSAES